MTDTLASFAVDVPHAELEPSPLAPEDVLDGHPEVHELALDSTTTGDVTIERGIWQITPGTVRDVEVDELFVVVSGRATLEIADGPTLELAPGVLGVLRAGDRTVWRIHETLRKVYQATVPAEGA